MNRDEDLQGRQVYRPLKTGVRLAANAAIASRASAVRAISPMVLNY
jgi:hypothetical protein